jgi:hypothetical protein
MIAYVKATRRQALLNAFARKRDAARDAVRGRNGEGFQRARGEMIEIADSAVIGRGKGVREGSRGCHTRPNPRAGPAQPAPAPPGRGAPPSDAPCE